MAQMIDFFTKPWFKHAQNQSHKGGSLEARKPQNKNECFTSLNKVSGFLVLKLEYIRFLSVPVAGRCRPVPAGAGPYV